MFIDLKHSYKIWNKANIIRVWKFTFYTKLHINIFTNVVWKAT